MMQPNHTGDRQNQNSRQDRCDFLTRLFVRRIFRLVGWSCVRKMVSQPGRRSGILRAETTEYRG